MRVCDIVQFYSPLSGGVRRYISDKQRYLRACQGARHILIVPSARNFVTRTPEGVCYEIASPRLPGSSSYRLLLDRKKILQAVYQERPDLIEVGDPYRAAWIGLEAGRQLGVPVVAYYHSDFPRAIGRTMRRFGSSWLERIVSTPVQSYLVRLYNRMAATVVATRRLSTSLASAGFERIVRVPLGTDCRVFFPRNSRARVREELGLPPGVSLLMFAGRMAREKNIRNLIGSLDQLPAAGAPCHLMLVGDGELGALAREESSQRKNLTWIPHCDSPSRLAELYSAADLFVHAGRSETFGLVALEAQACGTPVLVVKEGGVEEALVDATVAPARDASSAALADGICGALSARENETTRAARARAVGRHHSTDITFEQMFALYRHLIARRAVSGFRFAPRPEAHELLHTSI